MNLQKNDIKRYILRRYSIDELESILNQKLNNQSRNLKHYADKSLDKFMNIVVYSITDEILEQLTDGWVEDSPIPEKGLYEFIEELFGERIIKKYDELRSINLQEQTNRIGQSNMKIKSINVIKGKNKWSESRTKLIHMVLDLGEYEQKPSNKIDGFYERIKEHLPSLKSHRCSIGKPGGFFKRIKDGTWMGHIIEHVALELQTLAGYDTGWGRTRGVKGKKGVYNVVFNYEDEEKGKMAAKDAFKVVNDIINDIDPQIDKIVKKLKQKNLQESIRRILREEISAKEAYNEYDSIKTIIDGKRDVAFTTLENPTTKFLIFINGLKKIKVESEDETNYIVYQKRSEDLAKELFNIANKYGGKLRFDATEEDSRRIGQILNYNPKEIEDYISHNKKIRDLENNQSEEQIQESIRRILKEELYSPASDEHTPGKFVVHKSNPVWRENIELTGLQTSVGDCYQQHVGGDEECKPSIFATDSLDKEQMFDSTYDDDIWIINTECAEVTWYKDRHFDNGDYKHHIVTFENISPECLRLLHKGTGKSY